MISSDFAPNETREDASLALKLLFQPWKWRRGKETNNLKRRLKSRFFSSDTHISLFLSARGALYQYIKTLALPPGTKVLVSGFTPITCILPILEHELQPVYIDIHKEDLSMNFNDLQGKYDHESKLLILKHPNGITPKDRKDILAFAKDKKLTVIEEVSQGFDPNLFKQKRFTSTLLLSFSRTAYISSVLGGAIVIRGKRIAELMRDVEKNIPNASFWLILQIIFYKIGSVVIKKTYNIYFGKLLHFVMRHFSLIPATITKNERKGQFDPLYLKRYPNICVIFLMKQLDRFNDVSAKRKRITSFYMKQLMDSKPASKFALTNFPFFIHSPVQAIKILKQYNITLSTEYNTLQNEQINHHVFGYKMKNCPVCENQIPHIVKLPTTISKRDSQKLITRLKKVVSSQK